MKSRLAIFAVFFALLSGVYAVAVYRAQNMSGVEVGPPVIKPAVVRCEPLEYRTYRATESFWGLVEANTRVDMAFQIAGRVSVLGRSSFEPLVENQSIKKGEQIARLEPLRYEAAVEQARARIQEAKAAMNSAHAVVAQAKARHEDAVRELERMKRLTSQNAANQRELEKAQLALDLAVAEVDNSEAQRASSEASYSSAHADLTMASVNLQDATLTAPMDATVAVIPVEIGQMITPAQPVVTLIDLSSVKLVIGVVERKLPLLREGQQVTVEVQALMSQSNLLSDSDSLSKPRRGVITVVPPSSDPVTGLFNVEVALPNEDGALYPGMVGKSIVTVHEQRALAIPAGAAFRAGDRAWAYFVTRGYQAELDLSPLGKASVLVPAPVAKRVQFEPVASGLDYYLLKEAPAGVQQLIVEGHNRLSDGQTVHVINSAAGGASAQDDGDQASVAKAGER